MPCLRMPRIRERPSGESWDSRSESSVYWGKTYAKVKMCPHIKPGGGQCGLTAEFCMCMCLLCGAPMRARKRCGAWISCGVRCPWGEDRSPEVSSPEQSPPNLPIARKRRWYLGPAPPTPHPKVATVSPARAEVHNSPAPSLLVALARTHPGDGRTPLINFVSLVAGGPDPPMPATAKRRGRPPKPKAPDARFSLDTTPASSPPPQFPSMPLPKPPTTWNTNKPPPSASIPPTVRPGE
jgi:hypothetical protein